MSLEEAIHELSEHYGVYFTYNKNLVNNYTVEFEVDHEQTLNNALEKVLVKTTLNYKIHANKYVIIYRSDKEGIESLKEMVKHLENLIYTEEKRSGTALTYLPSRRLGDKFSFDGKRLVVNVTGTVTDQRGEPLIGVNVIVKGSEKGTATDFNGKFTIEDVDEQAILLVSYIGFQSKEIALNGKTNLSITLIEDSQTLDEVVVVGFGTQKKENLTGAVSQVTSEVLESRPITNLGQGLQGVIPNLNVNVNSGAPGRGSSFNIRGTTSINGGNPLILVDGVVKDINLINPDDIASISVLKDAASAAIYGARAAYGVILITTKAGTASEKPVIGFSSNWSFNRPTAKPEYMNSLEYANWMNAANTTTNGSNYFDDETMQHIQAYFENPQSNEPVFHHSNDPSNLYRYNANTDWTDVMLKDSYPISKYNLSISGGGDKMTYYSSIGLLNQKGLMKWFDEDFNRYNFVQNLNYDVNPWIEVGLKASLNITEQTDIPDNKRGSFSNVDNLYMAGDSRPIMPIYHPDGHFAGYSGNGYFTNMPAFLTQGGDRKYKTNDIWVTGLAKLTPLEGLSLNLDYTINYFNRNNIHTLKEYWDFDATGPATLFPHTTPNWISKEDHNDKYIAINMYADYEKNWNDIHYFKAMVGYNQEEKQFNSFWVRRANLLSNEIPFIDVAIGERNGGDAANEWAIRGGFFRMNYSFSNRYLIEVNGRYDGSSRFPKDDRFKFYPSLSLGWRLSSENFWSSLKPVLEEFKIRASVGSLGNQSSVGNDYYPYIASYNTGQVNYLLNGERPATVFAPGLVSPTLTWETVEQTDIGVDLETLNGRLTTTFDWYVRKTKDMLTKSKTRPAILGVSEPQANAADLETKGWELMVSWKDYINKDFSYDVGFMLSDYVAEITKFDNPDGVLSDYYVGQTLGEIWGLTTAGLFVSDEEAQSYNQSEIVGHNQLAGDIKFEDLDGDGKISRGGQTLDDHGDLSIIGNSNPRYAYGFRVDVSWKNFNFGTFFQGIAQRDFYPSGTFFYSHYTSQWAVPQSFNTDYWTVDNTDAYFPRPRLNGREITTAQTRYLQNGSYLRCKQITLGYNIPQEILNRIKVERCNVYLTGQNLFEFTQVQSVLDPESNRVNMYPLNRAVSVGLNLSF
ncbi:TonB-dependent receptor [Membranihabitans marinus]